jgi:hypothetical protein
MIDAGIERLLALLEAGVGSDHLVTEVFLATYSYLGHASDETTNPSDN